MQGVVIEKVQVNNVRLIFLTTRTVVIKTILKNIVVIINYS